MKCRSLLLLLLVAGLLSTAEGRLATPTGDGQPDQVSSVVDFDRDVRPIMARYCLPCHGNDGSSRKKNLRLDDEQSAKSPLDRQYPAFNEGDPDHSLALLRILDDEDPMPPDGRDRPSADEIEMLRLWVEQGAPYTRHWSWQPITEPALPQLKNVDWARAPLDRFVLTSIEAKGLTPAPDADRRTWLRRVTFDLTGLPPTTDEIDAFLNDTGADARESVVDRLLESFAYAEHFGRHWLDLVRYAETHGHEFDYAVGPAWRYRDWVIRAIDADVPIDRFVSEQIAGDLLENPRVHPEEGTNDSIPGTGWFWLSQGTHAPVDVLQDTFDRVDNQIDVISRSFLGATVSCARCHDHKFDSITQADWTGLSGIIRSTRRVLYPQDPGSKIASKVEEMAPLRDQLTAATRQGMEIQQSRPLVQLARSARQLLQQKATTDGGEVAPEIVLNSFEEGWGDWQVEGEAFGEKPHSREQLFDEQPDEVRGQFAANSHDRRPGTEAKESDARKGKLTSPSFLVDRDYLLFMIGGGQHAGRSCVNLIIDEEVVHSATGRNHNRMNEVRWDVGRWRGQQARIEVVDDHDGEWGHVSCDHFLLTDQSVEGMPGRSQIEQVALQQQLDGNELREWVRLWPVLDRANALKGQLAPDDLLLADFSGANPLEDWTVVGDAFEVLPAGEVLLIGRPRIVDATCAHSAARGRGLVGSILSRNFIIDHRFLHLRVQGESTRVRICIEGYWIDQHNALLFENFRKSVNSPDQWQHLQIDLARYQGRNAHVEIHDEGRGWVAVDRVWLSSEGARQGSGADWSVLDDEATDSAMLLADPVRAEALLSAGLVDPARYGDAWNAAVVNTVQELRRLDESLPQPVRILAAVDAPIGFDVPLSVRGDPNEPGEIVARRALENLGGADALENYREGSGREALANWITATDNPLFWRTQANRLWARVMGRGVAATSDDLGALGIPPRNLPLLDHLAIRLRENPSRRALLRDIVLSRSYQMASTHPDPRSKEIDAANDTWHRSHQKRLTAESIRDSILSVSGRIDRKIGGASVPVHLTDFITGRGRPGGNGPVDGHGRRSIYIKVCRNFLPPFLTAFDFPIPATTVGDRMVTNVPAQALTLMNDPFVHDQARLWGERVMKMSEENGLVAGIESMWQQAFGRLPSGEEVEMAREFVSDRGQEGWTDLAHTLIQAKEFRFIR